jgi:hypothetical protein
MITSTSTECASRRSRLLGIAVAAGLGWVVPAAAASAIVRPPPVANGLDRGIWVTDGDDDDADVIAIAGHGMGFGYRRTVGGRLREAAAPAA